MILTICILSIPERLHKLAALLQELIDQSRFENVEILYLGDNMTRSVGSKRNAILNIAQGKYIAFFDDDDLPTVDYLKSLIEATKDDPDVITFMVDVLKNGKPDRYYVYEKIYRKILDPALRVKHGRPVLTLPPNHLCAWKTELARQVKFPDKSKGEDHVWGETMFSKFRDMKIHNIDRPLYIYRFDEELTRTRR